MLYTFFHPDYELWFSLYPVRWDHMSGGRLPEVQNNRKIQNVSPRSGRLQEVVACD